MSTPDRDPVSYCPQCGKKLDTDKGQAWCWDCMKVWRSGELPEQDKVEGRAEGPASGESPLRRQAGESTSGEPSAPAPASVSEAERKMKLLGIVALQQAVLGTEPERRIEEAEAAALEEVRGLVVERDGAQAAFMLAANQNEENARRIADLERHIAQYRSQLAGTQCERDASMQERNAERQRADQAEALTMRWLTWWRGRSTEMAQGIALDSDAHFAARKGGQPIPGFVDEPLIENVDYGLVEPE